MNQRGGLWALADRAVLAAVKARVLGPGTAPLRIGTYEVERPLGQGAMGRVWLARDPGLDRRVALKLIAPELCDLPAARMRIVREARAMAQLSDPNVAQVFEVGEDGPHLFVAMELIEGQNLRNWLDGGPRRRRDVLDAFIQAGRGLAAAHAGGIVHRDFKPENVMIDSAGRARVVDFGIARAPTEVEPPSATGRDDAPVSLTATGAWLGTPAYMAPEQWNGGEVDARTDQFAFCVALYEALAGQRPFAGGSPREIQRNLETTAVAPLPARARVPRRIEVALRRGLELDPARRWPGMDPLLRALDPRLRARAPIVLGIAIGITITIATTIAATRGGATCAGAGDPILAVWNPEARAATERAILAVDVPWAPSTASTLLARFDATVDAWGRAARAVCATDNPPSGSSACLHEVRARLRAEVERAGARDPAWLVEAVARAELLPDPRTCLQPAADLRGNTAHATATAALDRAARHLGELSIAEGADRYVASLAAGRAAAAEAWTAARESGAHGQIVRARWLAGRLALRDGDSAEAERALRHSAEVASEIGDAPMRAAATIDLVYAVGRTLDRADEALALGDDAAAMLAALGNPPLWTARLASHRASVLAHTRDPARAVELHRTAVDGLRGVLGEAHPDVFIELGNLGTALKYANRADESVVVLSRALERAREAWGDRHPRTARLEGTLGLARMRLGDLADARSHLERSLEVRARSLGDDHEEVASARFNLALVQRLQGDHAEAVDQLRRGLRTRESARGTDDPDHVAWLLPLGISELELQRLDDARATLQRALAICERHGASRNRFATLRFALARAWRDEDPARARVLAQTARTAWDDDPTAQATVDAFVASLAER